MILITFGTRPEYIKVLPVMKEMDKRQHPYKTFFTGQHIDLLKNIDEPDHRIEIKKGSNRLDAIVQSILNNESIFSGITSVMVQGDTTSAFATALAAFHRKIPVAHLEAGLRTYDKYNPYPEEFNRRAISALAEIHFAATETARQRLCEEGYHNKIYVVGNTVLDNIVDMETTENNIVVVTLHRREKHEEISQWFQTINDLARQYKHLRFVLPIHPNPDVRKHEHILTNVEVVEPLDHADFIAQLAACKYIITDSGGIQEEAAFLRKPCIVCRDFTERGEGLGTFSVLCPTPAELPICINWAENANVDIKEEKCPYGDGKASTYICNIYEQTTEYLTSEKL